MIGKQFLWLAGLLALTVPTLRGATIAWTNTSGGLWSAPLNWNPHTVPGSSDSANITAPGTYSVTVDTPVFIVGLALGGASGQQTLTNNSQTITLSNALVAANGVFNMAGGTLNGGPVTNQGTVNWSGGVFLAPFTVDTLGTLNIRDSSVTLEGALTNKGTVHWSTASASIGIANNHAAYNGAIYNQAGALFDMQSDQSVFCSCYGFESFVNAGTVRKSGGVNTSTIGVAFTNSGTVDAQSGTISFTGGGNIGGTYNTAAGAIIQFGSGNFTETGTVTVTGSGLCRQYGRI
jgi:hypothetical protein